MDNKKPEFVPYFKYQPSPSDSKHPHDHYVARLIKSAEDEEHLTGEWFDSPAEFGVETSPGKYTDKEIAGRKHAPVHKSDADQPAKKKLSALGK